jgi:2-aminoadipate transaminase
MMNTIKEEFPEGIKYTMPEGGLFTWVELPEYIDTKVLLDEALKLNVAFVPGASFFPKGGNTSSMRLNYSNMPEERIVEGIKRLAQVIRTHMK